MSNFYEKYKKCFWPILLAFVFFDVGLWITHRSIESRLTHEYVMEEDEQSLIIKLSQQVRQMADNGFFCHLGGLKKENMNSDFCRDFNENRINSSHYALTLTQQLIDKKCQSHDLFVGLAKFSYVLEIVSRNESDEKFQFTNLNLREAFVEQSKIFESINIKESCDWN